MEHEQRMGGWTTFETTITVDEKKAFDEATNGLVGVGYEPVAVATQVVSGMNYRFFCNSTTVTAHPSTDAAIVEVHQDLNGHSKLVEVKSVDL